MPAAQKKRRPSHHAALAGDLMILPDGNILARRLTPELARALSRLNPRDAQMKKRSRRSLPPTP